MSMDFTVDDALELGYVADPAWNSDASRVGYLDTSGGRTRFAHAIPGSASSIVGTASLGRDPDADITDFAWQPGHPGQVALVADGNVEMYDVDAGEARTLAHADADHSDVTWLDTTRLLYRRDSVPWVHDLDDGSVRELDVGPTHTTPFGAPSMEDGPDNRYLLTLVGDGESPDTLVAYDVDTDTLAWSWGPGQDRVIAGYEWVGSQEFVYTLDDIDAGGRCHRAVRFDSDEPDEAANGPPGTSGSTLDTGSSNSGVTLLSETDDIITVQGDPVGTDDGWMAVLSARTGYAHLYLVDVDARRTAVQDGANWSEEATPDTPGFEGPGVVQVTDGAHEARGDATDLPAWSPTGDRIAFVTNEADPGDRRLQIADRDGQTRLLVDAPGNVLYPEWGDDDHIVCIRAGRTTPANVTVVDLDADDEIGVFTELSDVAPPNGDLSAFPEPSPVAFEGTGGLTIRGYLYTPPGADAADDRPAVVWCHGGPVRQMRRGFHHMRSYAMFHAFNHVLVSRGYVVLELNYRGGIGYGQAFENGLRHAIGVDDVDDCVRAAEWLRNRPYVGDDVGLWGLSYGGFLANAVAATGSVDCAVNFAGIWNWRDWVRYAASLSPGGARRFQAQFGGHPDESDAEAASRYATASPSDSVEAIDTPLFALHGTDDPNVPFDQMDALVEDCVETGHEFEMAYYPAEGHMFEAPATWRDALGRVLPFLEKHLRASDPDGREGGISGVDRIG